MGKRKRQNTNENECDVEMIRNLNIYNDNVISDRKKYNKKIRSDDDYFNPNGK